jgi:glycosyltransferase involved in cell wall biosynthesis
MKTFIVMPGLNVEDTIEKTFVRLPDQLKANVVFGDNHSTDNSANVAESLGITVLRHEKNYGFGGNLKRLYHFAIEQEADIVVDLHPDYQYEPMVIDIMIAFIERGFFEVMQGNRIRRRDEALAGGMPLTRYIGNRSLTFIENLWFGMNLGEWHSGLKAFRTDVLKCLPFDQYPNTHAFANEILMDCVMEGFSIGEVPIPIRYEEESSSTSLKETFDISINVFSAALRRPPWKKKKYCSIDLPALSSKEVSKREND